jgi:hypothetical protein
MSHGNEYRLYSLSGAQNCSHRATVQLQRGIIAHFGADVTVGPAQPALGAPYRRDIEQQAEMGSQPESARVRHSLSIAYENVGFGRQLSKRLCHDGRFPEAEQTGNVGKHRFVLGSNMVHRLKRGKSKDRNYGVHSIAPLIIRHVGTCDSIDRPLQSGEADLLPQLVLDCGGLFIRHVPLVQPLHAWHFSESPMLSRDSMLVGRNGGFNSLFSNGFGEPEVGYLHGGDDCRPDATNILRNHFCAREGIEDILIESHILHAADDLSILNQKCAVACLAGEKSFCRIDHAAVPKTRYEKTSFYRSKHLLGAHAAGFH